MNKAKKDLLEKTYQQFMQVGFNELDPTMLEGITDKSVMGFGTTFDEKIFSLNEMEELLRRQHAQSEGMKMTWNSQPLYRHISTDENIAVYADDVFLHVQIENETLEMYMRFSLVLEYKNDKWLMIHWHASKPEEVESEKDTFGIDTWKEKAEALEKIIKERTADLVVKNRELEIEAALERVRTVAMSMNKADDMLSVCKTISHQMELLSVKEIRNVQTAIFYTEKGTYINYEYYTKHNKTFITETSYTDHEIHRDFADSMLKGTGEFMIVHIKGDEVKDWIAYQKTTNVFFDDFLYTASSLNYYWFSLGPVALGISTYEPLKEEEINLFKRFLKVFELAYRRYLDIEKAEEFVRQAENDLIEIKAARKKAEETLVELQSTQKQLIQSEKMASLGELTAGIAHEIQNPLNFVNNFSEVSNELMDEMNEELNKGDISEAKIIANDIKQNLEKINHHGKRAGDIVKGMLQHSRASTGTKEPTDINALADEYLRLAYHGLRAKDKSFNAKFSTNFDESIGTINIIQQDMGRVILNLITNAFYAVNEKAIQQLNGNFQYEPTVSVSSRKKDDTIFITVNDNGNGIPQNIIDKIFQPFFTTKPTGSGTGLGLSLSYDIVKAHGGEIKVESKGGEGSTFIIQLPIHES